MAKRISADIRMVKIEKDIEYIKEKNETAELKNAEEHNEIKNIMLDFIQSADNKYATKFTEKAFWWTVVTVLSIIIGVLFKYIFLNTGIHL